MDFKKIMSLIPRLRPQFGFKEIVAALAWWRGGVREFEKEFSEKFSVKHALAFSYGRTGLYTLLKALGLKDDEVICPAYTCVVVPHAITLSGNAPVFVDCAENSFNMDYEGIERAITDKTRAIIVTHLFGYPMDCERILEIVGRAKQRIYVIHDCAHSFGAKWNGKYVWEYGDAVFFAFGIGKLISALYGGLVSTQSDEIAAALQRERQSIENKGPHLIWKSIGRFVYMASVMIGFHPRVYSVVNWVARKTSLLKGWTDYYDGETIEFPGDVFDPMLGIEGRIGIQQLRRYSDIVSKRVKRAGQYAEGMNNDDQYPLFVDGATYSHFPVVVQDRVEWLSAGRIGGFEYGQLIEYSIPHMLAYGNCEDGDYPNSRYLSNHVINIPIWTDVSTSLVMEGTRRYSFDGHWGDYQREGASERKIVNAGVFLRPARESVCGNMAELKILDVGCGDGVHCEYLSREGDEHFRYTGIDISSECIDRLKDRYSEDDRFEFSQCDACSLPFSNNEFDIVFSYGVIGYTTSPKDAFFEMTRVLKDDGKLGLWVYPDRSGVGGGIFKIVRRLCSVGGSVVANCISNMIVPLLSFLPTASKMHLGNSKWSECKEVVMVNIAPDELHFFNRDEIRGWCCDRNINIVEDDDSEPITIWGTKGAA
jgi:perosamine synthetase